VSTQSIFTPTLRDSYYHPHFRNEEAEAQKSEEKYPSSQVINPESESTGLRDQCSEPHRAVAFMYKVLSWMVWETGLENRAAIEGGKT
jgi:hypothetical protein